MSFLNTLNALKSVKAVRDVNVPKDRGLEVEPLTEAEFVRKFGVKVKRVRYSRRTDFVGLILYGEHNGIWIVRSAQGTRLVRLLDLDKSGKVSVLKRFVLVRQDDSLSNMVPGLLNFVR